MGKCPFCGGELIWQNDFNGEDYGYVNISIVRVLTCSECNSEIEASLPCDEEE